MIRSTANSPLHYHYIGHPKGGRILRHVWIRVLSFTLLAAVALTAGQVQAQTPTGPPPGPRDGSHGHRFFGRPLFGTIASVSAGSLVLTTWTGDTVTLQTSPTTRTLSRQRATLSDLAVGDFARVVAAKAPNGTLTARSVSGVAASAAAPASGPAGGAPGKPGPRGGGNRMGGAIAGGRDGMVVISGRLTAVSGSTMSIASPVGTPITVGVPPDARISRLVSPPLSSLAPGTHVIVHAARPRTQPQQGTSSGTARPPLTAVMIMVVPAGTR